MTTNNQYILAAETVITDAACATAMYVCMYVEKFMFAQQLTA